MEINLHIKLEVPEKLKRWVRVVVPGLVFVGMIGTVQADAIVMPNEFVDGEVVSADQMNANFVALAEAIDQAVPVGTVMAYYGTTAPEGWIVASGVTIDKVVNPSLTNLVDHLRDLNTEQGISNLSDTNQAVLPDMRGLFLRGKNNNLDDGYQHPDGELLIGERQMDTYQGHTHGLTNVPNVSVLAWGAGGGGSPWTLVRNDSAVNQTHGSQSDGSNGAPRVSMETRPKNMTVLYIIKY
jgi:hypothetical protein